MDTVLSSNHMLETEKLQNEVTTMIINCKPQNLYPLVDI